MGIQHTQQHQEHIARTRCRIIIAGIFESRLVEIVPGIPDILFFHMEIGRVVLIGRYRRQQERPLLDNHTIQIDGFGNPFVSCETLGRRTENRILALLHRCAQETGFGRSIHVVTVGLACLQSTVGRINALLQQQPTLPSERAAG